MKYLYFIIILSGILSCRPNPDAHLVSSTLLTVPYGQNPTTPSQHLLDSIAVLPIDSLVKIEVDIAPDRKQFFFTRHDKVYTGWAREDFQSSHNRIRYYQIDSGFVNWQIGYFDIGQLECDFHALHGFNHGSQRMWSRDGMPYIALFSTMGKKHGLQQRWHPNGILAWEADFDTNSLIYEVYYSPEGKIRRFDGAFSLPIPNNEAYEEMKLLLPESSGFLEAYLHYYFESTGEKQPLRTRGENICHYSITFAESIKYESKSCNAGSGYSIVSLPKVSNVFSKRLLHATMKPYNDDDPFRWSVDTLFYTEDGIPGSAGCNIVIEQSDSLTTIGIYCTD